MFGQYDELIRASCEKFLGYGPACPASAQVWFVGIQQGGGGDWNESRRRLEEWHKRGRRALEEIVGYHRAILLGGLFDDPPKKQQTWRELIRIRLAMADETISDDSIDHYQVNRLAGWNGENCLLELLPLSSQNPDSTEVYKRISNLKFLEDGNALMAVYAKPRAQLIKEMVDRYQPKIVVFYSAGKRYM